MRRLLALLRDFGVTVLGFVLLLNLIAAILLLRAYFFPPEPSAAREFAFDPYAIYVGSAGYDKRGVVHNERGFRRNEPTPVAKPDGTYRIFFGGGSAAWGAQSTYERKRYPHLAWNETIDHALETELEDRLPGSDFEVINVAAMGYWSHQSRARYAAELRYYAPDMFIVLDGHNDWYLPPEDRELRYDHPYLRNYTWPVTDRSLAASGLLLLRTLGQGSTWLRDVADKLTLQRLSRRAEADRLRRAEISQGFDLGSAQGRERFAAAHRSSFERHILPGYRHLGAMLHSDGVRFVIAMQPELLFWEKDELTPEEARLWDRTVEFLDDPDAATRWRLQRDVNVSVLTAASEKLHADFVDTHPDFVLEGGPQLFTDYCHTTPAGAQRVATLLAQAIEESVRSDLAARQ